MNSAIRASSLRRTQVERKDDSEQKMIDAAIRLIAKKGMEGLTLGAGGIEAGYSRGLPSHHFGTKTELIRAVARTIKNKNFKDLASVTEGALGLDGLKKLVAYYFERDSAGSDNSKTVMALLCASLHDDFETAEITREHIAYWCGRIQLLYEEAISLGQVNSELDVSAQAALLFGTLRGTLLQFMVAPNQVSLVEASRALQFNLDSIRL